MRHSFTLAKALRYCSAFRSLIARPCPYHRTTLTSPALLRCHPRCDSSWFNTFKNPASSAFAVPSRSASVPASTRHKTTSNPNQPFTRHPMFRLHHSIPLPAFAVVPRSNNRRFASQTPSAITAHPCSFQIATLAATRLVYTHHPIPRSGA
jgi:hypothetical protein